MLTVKDFVGKRFNREDFLFFWGHEDRKNAHGIDRTCLSQWYMAPMVIDGNCYNCMEQYLMAEKARIFGDTEIWQKIMSEYNQMTIKKLGRQVRNYDDTVWREVRQEVSVWGNLAKFNQNDRLRDYLLSTGSRILVEASPKDRIWGIGFDENSVEATNPSEWRGKNLLGFALMEVRTRLQAISDRFQSILTSLKNDPWKLADVREFVGKSIFSGLYEWECDDIISVFDSTVRLVTSLDSDDVSKILINIRFGSAVSLMMFAFIERMRELLDPIAVRFGFDYMLCFSPDDSLPDDDTGVKMAVLTI